MGRPAVPKGGRIPRRAGARAAEGATRGEETRRRLIEVALRVFGAYGFDGVSTRHLAHEAGVNLAAIPYHYGGKEGLYLAAAEHLVATNEAVVREAVARARSLATDDADALAGALRALLRELAAALLGPADAPARAAFIMREQLQAGRAYEVLYAGFMRPIHETVALLVGRLTGRQPESEDAIVRAHAVIGQIIAFAIARETVLRRLGWDDYTPERLARIADTVADMALRAVRPGGGG